MAYEINPQRHEVAAYWKEAIQWGFKTLLSESYICSQRKPTSAKINTFQCTKNTVCHRLEY